LKADIGTRVVPGQVLAEIDAPDLDQQIMQAKADLASAQAAETLARVNLERGRALISSGAVSKRDLDQRAAEFDSRQALVKSSQANVERLLVLEGYKRILAPFAGIVTVRATDVGALINAGSGGGPALFVVSDVSRLKVYVNVPQSYVPAIPIGTRAEIAVPEYPDRTFGGTVAASAQAVDVASGTTRMQISVENHEGVLMTGAYASVRLELPRPEVSITVPASALIFDQNGMRVATVGAEDRISLKPITIARDLGREVEVATGLTAQDRIIVTPPDGVLDGDKVLVIDKSRAPSGTADNKARGKPPG
jgi:RND family efflux transporter MFP subunit